MGCSSRAIEPRGGRASGGEAVKGAERKGFGRHRPIMPLASALAGAGLSFMNQTGAKGQNPCSQGWQIRAVAHQGDEHRSPFKQLSGGATGATSQSWLGSRERASWSEGRWFTMHIVTVLICSPLQD
jgi:hypothetical protein